MRKSRSAFIDAVHARCARLAVSQSTLHGPHVSRVLADARAYLATFPLERFSTCDGREFQKQLDRETEQLVQAMKKRRRWGVARKIINLFLRDALYNVYLRTAFALKKAERLLELPLDSNTATSIRKATRGWELDRPPRWPGLKRLTSQSSEAYQNAAQRIAGQCPRRIARVHLDLFWWPAIQKPNQVACKFWPRQHE